MTKTLLALGLLSTASLATVLHTGHKEPARAATSASEGPAPLTRESFIEDTLAPSVKPPSYDITIVEYFDYQCPFCRQVHPALKQLAGKDKKIRILYRDWPIFGDDSVEAARVAIASQWQGKHAAVHDALMNTPRPLNAASIKAAAVKAGVDWARLQSDLQKRGREVDALLERNNEQAEALGLEGTPAFIIGNYLVPGGLDLKALESAVKEAREKPAPKMKALAQPEGI